jgi:HEAT repeat protein
LAIDEAHVPQGASVGALAEIEVYTDLDFGGAAVDKVAAELDQGGIQAARAGELLARLGERGELAIEAALPSLAPEGRARAARALAGRAASSPKARGMLAALLADPDDRVRTTALEALLSAGPEPAAQVSARIAVADAFGDKVALALARAAPSLALPSILAAIEQAGGSRPKLREALSLACDGAGVSGLSAVRGWLENPGPNVSARAAVALALASNSKVDGAAVLAGDVVTDTHARAEEFEDLYRLVLAARSARSGAEIDGWLMRLVAGDERWMLRAAALEALVAREAGEALPTARKALSDEYPRVRVTAAKALASDASAAEALATHALRDRWGMVRAAAVLALAARPSARATIAQALKDQSSQVRVAAIAALTQAGARDAFGLVEERLRDEHESPEVVAAAIELVRTLCLSQGKDALLARLARGLTPHATSSDAELAAQAFDTLIDLGGASAEAALAAAKSEVVPPGFRTRATQARERLAKGNYTCATKPAAAH